MINENKESVNIFSKIFFYYRMVMLMDTHLYFIRHGETVWNQEGRYQGHTDIGLSEAGRKQAGLLADYLESYSFSTIYSSDLARARQTAEQIASKHGLMVQTNVNLRERYGGEWEGLTMAEIEQKYLDWEQIRWSGGAYGMETTEKVKARMQQEIAEIIGKHPAEQVVIVGHGMSLNALFAVLTKGERGYGKTRLRNTSLTHFCYHPDEGWTCHQWNETPHLVLQGDEV
jgi:broad specificity phosphatase PhoE